MIDRRMFIGAIGAAAIAPAHAQSPARRVAYLHPAIDNPAARTFYEHFKAALAGHGWAEGRTLALDLTWAGGSLDKLEAQAAEAVRRQADALFVIGHAVYTARKATRTVPIIAVNLEGDPVADRLVESLGRPGGNVTGIFLNAPELGIKHLQLLKELAPAAARVAVLSQPGVSDHQLAAVRSAAERFGVTLVHLPFTGPQDIAGHLAAMRAADSQGLLVLPSPLVNGESKAIAAMAMEMRVPSISIFRAFTEYGGLVHYGPRLKDMFERAAFLVDRVLRGARPGELPVEQPTRFELLVNAKTAKALGLEVPASILVRADEVIE
jgi:putative ABC transport system substrate-binding protein